MPSSVWRSIGAVLGLVVATIIVSIATYIIGPWSLLVGYFLWAILPEAGATLLSRQRAGKFPIVVMLCAALGGTVLTSALNSLVQSYPLPYAPTSKEVETDGGYLGVIALVDFIAAHAISRRNYRTALGVFLAPVGIGLFILFTMVKTSASGSGSSSSKEPGTCPACGGSGVMSGGLTCSRCGGSGMV